jgi:hypothetical protein
VALPLAGILAQVWLCVGGDIASHSLGAGPALLGRGFSLSVEGQNPHPFDLAQGGL